MCEVAPLRTVCVLGFHRSGTSLAARVVEALGVEFGEDLLPAHEADNPQGYWEPRWMNELNDELLAALGTTWWRPFPGEPGWEASPTLAALRQRAADRYAAHLGDFSLAGWKDPRSTLTLPFWQGLTPEPVYLICVRNPVDAIASVQRRPEPTLSTSEWGDLWLEYTARALHGSARSPRTILHYDDWFDDPHGQVAALAALIGIADDDPRVAEAATLVEPDLRHHRSSPLDIAGAPGVSAPARSAYLALRAARDLRANPPLKQPAQRVCDAIERVVIDVWQANRDAIATRSRAHELATLAEQRNAQLDAAGAQLAGERANAAAQEQQTAAAQAEIHRLQEHAATLERSLSWRLTAPLRALMRRVRRDPR